MATKIAPPVLVISTFCLVFSAGFWWQILPQLRQLGASQAAVLHYSHMSTPPPVSLGTGATLSKQQLQEVKDSVNKLLPSTDNQYDLSVEIEALSKAAGVTLTALNLNTQELVVGQKTTSVVQDDSISAKKTSTTSPGSSSPAPTSAPAATTRKVTLTISTLSTYSNLQRFVAGLSSLDRFIQVDQLAMSVPPSAAGDQVVSQITAFAYFLPSTAKSSASTTK